MNPPGWYPSPERHGHMQYWDGMQWTSQYKSLDELPSSHLPPSAGAHYSSGGASGRVSVRGGSKGAPSMKQAVSLMLFGLLWLGMSALPVSATLSETFSQGPTVEGTVVEVRMSESRKRNSSTVRHNCSPVAEFTVDGKTYTASSNIFTSPCRWNTGQTVEVTYDADNPADARVKSSGFNALILVFPLIGLVVIGLGARMALRVRSEQRDGQGNDGFVPVGPHRDDW